jgi:hypothetical protein
MTASAARQILLVRIVTKKEGSFMAETRSSSLSVARAERDCPPQFAYRQRIWMERPGSGG